MIGVAWLPLWPTVVAARTSAQRHTQDLDATVEFEVLAALEVLTQVDLVHQLRPD